MDHEFVFFEEGKTGIGIDANVKWLKECFDDLGTKGYTYMDKIELKGGILFIFWRKNEK
jgi:hypothetical protein